MSHYFHCKGTKMDYFVMFYTMFLRKQTECIFLFSSQLLFSCFLIREMTCGSSDSLITGINSGWSCYSMLQLAACVRLYGSLHDRLQIIGNFRHLHVYPVIFTTCFTKVVECLDWSSRARHSLLIWALSRQLSPDAWRGKNNLTRIKSESRIQCGNVNNCFWSYTTIKC